MMNWKSSVCVFMASMFSASLATAQGANTYPWPSSGRVGIGTTTPIGLLDVFGGENHFANGTYADPDPGVPRDLKLGVDGLALNGGLIVNTGNVGIGTTAPAYTLDVVGGNARVAGTSYNTSGNYAGLYLGDGIAGVAALWGLGLRFDVYGSNKDGILGENSMDALTIQQVSGNVGIGTTSPSQALDVVGNIVLTGSITPGGGDYAESVDVTGNHDSYSPGDILVIDPKAPGKFSKSAEPYSTAVLGIYSTKPGVTGRRQITPKEKDEVPMAMVGIVPTKVSAENGAIAPGDLLVTSSTPGYAMKATDRSRIAGAVIGKALGNLDSGTGTIEVGITLQ